jgi:D-alanyl-D-alanine carboxypeptidase
MKAGKIALLAVGAYALFEVLKRAKEEILPTVPPFDHVKVGSGLYLRTDAGSAFLRMAAAARNAGISLPISTAWRSPEYQQRLYDAYLRFKAGLGPPAPLAAKPGTSNHEKGIAVDLSGIDPVKSNFDPARRAWLKANAATYRFYFSVPSEPWHMAWGVMLEGSAALVS